MLHHAWVLVGQAAPHGQQYGQEVLLVRQIPDARQLQEACTSPGDQHRTKRTKRTKRTAWCATGGRVGVPRP